MLKQCECGEGKTPQIFSVHFYNDTGLDRKNPDLSIDPQTGKANLSNWDRSPRPPGAWHPYHRGGVNFDYGFLTTRNTILHADMYHNPDNGHGKGKYFPSSPIRTATYFESSLDEWKMSYSDFNTEVWGVQCDGGRYGM